jgi:hypothetical protein
MQNSKLIALLNSLSKIEMNQLNDFIRSPFHNKNELVIQLFHSLFRAYPKFKDHSIKKEVLFHATFGNVPFKEQKLRYLMSDLTKLVESFLILKVLETKPVLQNHFLLTALQKKHLSTLSPVVLEQSRKNQNKYPFLDQLFYYNQFMIESDHYEYIATKRNLAVKENLTDILENLDHYFLINKLKFSAELINHSNVYAGEINPLLLDEILLYIAQNTDKQVIGVQVYYTIIRTLLDPDNVAHYYKLKELLENNIESFPIHELNDMFIFARNYCAKQINSGKSEFLNEIFDLYETLIHNKIIYINGYLSQWDYKNIVAVGLRLNELDWVKSFIKEYKTHVDPEHSTNAYNYNLAMYHFYSGDFGKSLELIRDVEFTDVYYHLDCKSLLMKTYIELKEYEALHSLTEAFYVYLRRNKLISDYQRTSYSNFLRLTKKMIRIKYGEIDKANDLQSEIEQTTPMPNKLWLLKKVGELK